MWNQFYKKAKKRRKTSFKLTSLFTKKVELGPRVPTKQPTQLSGFYYFYGMKNIKEYIKSLSSEKKDTVKKIISVIQKKLPKGFNEQINYGMPSWVVPHSTYPRGYHCSPELPCTILIACI